MTRVGCASYCCWHAAFWPHCANNPTETSVRSATIEAVCDSNTWRLARRSLFPKRTALNGDEHPCV